MAINVSPGVYTKIVDLSEYVRQVPSTIGFVPIISEKGPDNELVFTNRRDFYSDFGEPDINYAGKDYGSGPYIASSFLEQSDSLYVVRVLPEDATYACLVLYVNPSGDATSEVSIDWEEAQDNYDQDDLDAIFEASTDNKQYALIFYAIGRGAYYNNFKISLEKSEDSYLSTEDYIYYLKVWQKQDFREEDATAGSTSYKYEVVESFVVSLDYTKLDSDGSSRWIEDVVNNGSKIIRCKSDQDVCKTAVEDQGDFAEPFTIWSDTTQAIDAATGLPAYDDDGDEEYGAYIVDPKSLSGEDPEVDQNGSDGKLFDSTTGLIDSAEANTILIRCYKGILKKAIDNTEFLSDVTDNEAVYFSLVFDGGYPSQSIKDAIKYLCETRGDCVGIVDNGDNYTASDAIKNRKGTGSDKYTQNLNYKSVAIYEGFSKIFDEFTGRDLWMTPVFHLAKVIPYSDNETEIWYAPAGFNRGTLSNVKELRYSPNLAERDQFYLNQLNPIVRFTDVGDVVFGQLTSQRRPTALQDLNVVRMVLYVQRALQQFCKYYLFEQNDADTWGAISAQVNIFLAVVQQKRGLRSYSVEVGATEYELKAKWVHVNVTLEPMKVVEQIHLTFFIK